VLVGGSGLRSDMSAYPQYRKDGTAKQVFVNSDTSLTFIGLYVIFMSLTREPVISSLKYVFGSTYRKVKLVIFYMTESNQTQRLSLWKPEPIYSPYSLTRPTRFQSDSTYLL
jgi:hypothetical protein